MQRTALYREFFIEFSQRLWVKIALGIWTFICTYDTFQSQFLSEETAKRFPKAWQVPAMTGDLLPFWGWVLILASILVAGSLEYAIRSKKRIADLERAPRGDTLSATATVGPPTPIPSSTERIQFIDLLREAEKRGVDFKGNNPTILEFCSTLRQSASDGDLKFWGRERRQSDPLIEIPSTHWKDFQIDWIPAFVIGPPSGEIKGFADNNFFVGTRTLDHRKAYFDLHVNHIQAFRASK